MEPMSLPHAIHMGMRTLNRSGVAFAPNMARLVGDFQSPNASAVLALPATGGAKHGYELVKYAVPDMAVQASMPDITVGDVWACAKEHYGLTTATVVTGAGGMPIPKKWMGHRVMPGSSKYTNLVSHTGVKFFPMTTLPHGSTAAKIAKQAFGTIRVFGIVGRALPFVAIGLAAYDAISIGMCAYEQRNGAE